MTILCIDRTLVLRRINWYALPPVDAHFRTTKDDRACPIDASVNRS